MVEPASMGLAAVVPAVAEPAALETRACEQSAGFAGQPRWPAALLEESGRG